jgi:hypothetical protein
MSNKNTGFEQEVADFVASVLAELPQPHGSYVIEDVLVRMDVSPRHAHHYQQLCATHKRGTVNSRVGHFTRTLTGYGHTGTRQKTTRTNLAKTFTVLIPHNQTR